MKSQAILAGLLVAAAGTAAGAERVELDPMTITGAGRQLALRTIQVGLANHRSTRSADADKVVCWFGEKTGSRLKYLFCATNGALNEISRETRDWMLHSAGARPGRGRENIFVSPFPVSEKQLTDSLRRLGSVSVSRELVRRARSGKPVPANVPMSDELDRFIAARRRMDDLDLEWPAANPADQEAARSILRRSGITGRRFSELLALLGELPSLNALVAGRR